MKNKLSIISSIILIAVLLASLASCSKETLQRNKTSEVPYLSVETPQPDIPTAPEIEYKFLFDSSFMMGGDTHLENVPKGFIMAKEHGFLGSEITKEFGDLKSTQKNIGDNTLTYDASNCTTKDASSDEIGSFYSVYDCYKNDSGDIAEYLHGTDILVRYSLNRQTSIESSDNKIGKRNARKIAEDFLLGIMTKETLDHFTYEDVLSDALGRYVVTYVRYVHGYRTDETIAVFLYTDGVFSGYNGRNLHKYDSFEKKVTKEQIETAQNALKNAVISTGLKNVSGGNSGYLTTDTSGKLYFRGEMWYESLLDLIIGGEIFVNVN